MTNKDEVVVLLATFNGEKYIGEFLESLVHQKDVSITLIASDDGSTDKTLQILREYASKFNKFSLIEGPRQGPAMNFFELLRNANGKYFALADQDDIWLPQHLSKSISTLKQFDELPTLTYGPVLEFGDGISSSHWPNNHKIKNLSEICFENFARGCTILLNKKLLDCINAYQPRRAVMHDWWLYLYASTYGKTKYIDEITVRYRLHESNAVGRRKRNILQGFRSVIAGNWPPYLQLLEFKQLHDHCYRKVINSEVLDIVNTLNGSKSRRICYFFFTKNRFRQSVLGELKFRFGLILLGSFLLRGQVE